MCNSYKMIFLNYYSRGYKSYFQGISCWLQLLLITYTLYLFKEGLKISVVEH